jgi:hypothetical protein
MAAPADKAFSHPHFYYGEWFALRSRLIHALAVYRNFTSHDRALRLFAGLKKAALQQ